jgi:hypothetical protein
MTPQRRAGRCAAGGRWSSAADSTKFATAATTGSVRVSAASPRGTAGVVLNGTFGRSPISAARMAVASRATSSSLILAWEAPDEALNRALHDSGPFH